MELRLICWTLCLYLLVSASPNCPAKKAQVKEAHPAATTNLPMKRRTVVTPRMAAARAAFAIIS